MRTFKWGLWLAPTVLLVFGVGCAHRLPAAPSSHHLAALVSEHPFGPRPAIPSAHDVHRLQPAQIEHFLAFFDDESRQAAPPHHRVAEYLKEMMSNFNYEGQTSAAHATLTDKAGNCLSLAVLTTALADAAGVEVGYELIDSAPVFEWYGTVVFRGHHVRTILNDLEWSPPVGTLFPRPQMIRIDYFPEAGDRFVRTISRDEYTALFYANLAAEAIREKQLTRAYWLLRTSLALDPQGANAWNSMAVVFRRANRLATAEAIYLHGIETLPEKVSFLRNYRSLLMAEQRRGEVAAVERLLEMHQSDDSPIDWLLEGQQAYRDGRYHRAIRHYRRALQIAPYLHAAHVGIAQAYYQLDEREQAEDELRTALELVNRPAKRTLYESKLAAIRRGQRPRALE